MSDEFYVGYETEMPPGLASHIVRVVRGLLAVALLMPGVLVFTQGRFGDGAFEFGRVRTFHGQVSEFPYPALQVTGASGTSSMYWLVGQGKHGAEDLVRGRDGQTVTLDGSLIQHDGDSMIEIVPGALTTEDATISATEPFRSRGIAVLEGEIVDSKCHLGVMKPGEGPTHRDCAVRCLLGWIPPMFVPNQQSRARRMPLVSDVGTPFVNAGAWAGRRVAIRGEVLQRGAQTFLAVSSRDIRLIH